MKPIFEMLAGYNAWANKRLYDVVATLSDEDYRADHGAFFGSVHGTLNHLLTGEGPSPTRLDAIQHDDFGHLRTARQAEDARIIAYVSSLTPEALSGTIRYRTISNPGDIEQELSLALLHVFNHQTHHRGQVHCLLTKITDEAPSLDLILYQRQTGIGLIKGAAPASSAPQRRNRR